MAAYLLLGGLILTSAVVGCSSESDSSGDDGINPGTPCEELIYDICEAACDCSDDCAWFANGLSASASDFDTCYEMEMAFGTCDGLEMDFEACAASILAEQCMEGPFGLRLELSTEYDELSGS